MLRHYSPSCLYNVPAHIQEPPRKIFTSNLSCRGLSLNSLNSVNCDKIKMVYSVVMDVIQYVRQHLLCATKHISTTFCIFYLHSSYMVPTFQDLQNSLTFPVLFPFFQYFYRPQTKLREGNVFTPVCHSVHGWGGWDGVSDSASRGWIPPWADTPPVEMTIEAGGTHPTGMHSCSNF